MDSPDLAGCSVAAVVVDDPVIQELPMPEPELSAQDWKLQGNAAIKEGDLEGAVSHYTAGLGVSHSDIEVEAVLCSNRALCLQKLGRHEEALADAERCMHLRPHFVKGFLRAAISLRALGRPCEALDALRRAPNDDEACSMAAELRPEAEAAEKVRLQTLPPAERMQAEADLSFAKGLFEVASARYSEVLRDAPEGSLAVAARMGRAACSHQLSDFKAVVDDTSFVLEREPANLVALSRRMLAFEPLEKYQAALADARAVLLQEPTNVTANKLQHRLGKLVRDIEREQSSTA
jgi:tetratricopeptide (TPR) repeat protein